MLTRNRSGMSVGVDNALQNHSGHCPNEFIFSFSINRTLILSDQLPALEATITSDMVRVNLNALHAARKSSYGSRNE